MARFRTFFCLSCKTDGEGKLDINLKFFHCFVTIFFSDNPFTFSLWVSCTTFNVVNLRILVGNASDLLSLTRRSCSDFYLLFWRGQNALMVPNDYTLFENHIKGLIPHCERSELRLHSLKLTKMVNIGIFELNFCYQTGQF